jgi:hypothetical protein
MLLTVLPALGVSNASVRSSLAQETSRTFPETGKTVAGKFLEYWDGHGALAQQGYPISEQMQEVSDLNGRTYTVQYFERAVFELHPENQAPNDVELSLLGVLAYRANYSSGAPGETANTQPSSVLFSETGKHLGGRFLNYWNTHGGLAQQGYPISEEFDEVSPLDHKKYRVQYFERAVFELHPENQPPNDVLLSQLGMLQYRTKYLQPAPTPTAVSPATPTAIATDTPAATATVNVNNCEGIPPTSPNDMEIAPSCIPLFGKVEITGIGFPNDDMVSIWATMPNGQVLGAPFDVPVQYGGARTVPVYLTVDDETPYFGIWVVTLQGKETGRTVYGYFKVVPQGTPIP